MWMKAEKTELGRVSRYLAKNEGRHVSLSSRFHKNGRRIWPANALVLIHLHEHEYEIDGLVMSDAYGYFFITLDRPAVYYDFEMVVIEVMRQGRPFCMMGQPEALQPFRGIFYAAKAASVNYDLMYWDYNQFFDEGSRHEVRQSSVHDFAGLKELERLYQLEEVLIAGTRHAGMEQILRSYKKKLQNERSFHIEAEKKILCKAGFSAEALHYDLLGGVFTLPGFRGGGLARTLIKAMQKDAGRRRKHISLFVKQHNTAAKHLYETTGFRYAGALQIIYPEHYD
jgi:GNAT superfamily N-acetyltransferase